MCNNFVKYVDFKLKIFKHPSPDVVYEKALTLTIVCAGLWANQTLRTVRI